MKRLSFNSVNYDNWWLWNDCFSVLLIMIIDDYDDNWWLWNDCFSVLLIMIIDDYDDNWWLWNDCFLVLLIMIIDDYDDNYWLWNYCFSVLLIMIIDDYDDNWWVWNDCFSVRLSPNVTYGAIQVRTNNNRYSLVCADNFTDTSARVICQEMGYSYGISICCSAFGRQRYSIAVTNVRCRGGETRLRDCPQDTSLTYCPSRKYASAACSNTNPRTGRQV